VSAGAPVALRDAATVMLVRDGSDGLEVFMLRRTLNAVFVGGFYVFPGGAVDDADRDPGVAEVCRGLTDAGASALIELPSGGLAYWVAAVRECFEEAGVLLAAGADGQLLDFQDPVVAARFETYRRAVYRGELRLVDLCAAEGLRLAVDGIHYVSHWITPIGEPRRFDTRFFVTGAPVGQEPLHDDAETIASLWTRPDDALRQYEAGELQLIIPTIKHLEFLAKFTSAAELLDMTATVRHPPVVQPRLRRVDGRVEFIMPGEPGYDAP
jgi:8-oxo-dGTP pyrophosphatase MutT (NUDIX family)